MTIDGMASGSEPRRRRGLLRRVLLGLLIAYAAYLAVANLLLNTGPGHALANMRPEKFQAGWDRAVTYLPGRVTVWNLKLAGNVRRTVWSVQADVVNGRIELLPLLVKQIRITGLRGEAVSGGATRIDRERPPSEPRPGGWKLVLDDVVVESLRHAYFNQLVLVGTGQGKTGIRKTLRGGPTEILPSQAEVHEAVLWWNGLVLLQGTDVTVEFAMEPTTRAEAPGIRKLMKMDIEVGVSATPRGLGLVAADGERPRLETTDDPGQLDARIAWHKGEFGEGSRLELIVPVRSADARGKAPAPAQLLLEAPGDTLRLSANFEAGGGSDFQLHSDLTMQGRAIPLPLESAAQFLGRTAGSVTGHWHFHDLAWARQMFPAAAKFGLQGQGSVEADIELVDGNVSPGSRVGVSGLSARAMVNEQTLQGSMRADLLLEPGEGKGAVEPELRAVIDHFELTRRDSPAKPSLEGRDLVVSFASETEPTAGEAPYRAHVEFPSVMARAGSLELAGSGQAELHFQAREAGKPLEPLPSRIEVHEGMLSLDGATLLSKARILASLSRAPGAGEPAEAASLLKRIDVETELGATVSGIRIEQVKGQHARLAAMNDGGRLRGNLRLQQGILATGSHLELSTPVYSPNPRDREAGHLDARLEVLEDAIDLKAMAGSGPDSDFHLKGDFRVRGREWPSPGSGFSDLASRLSGDIEGHWRFDDLEWLTRRLETSQLIAFTGRGRVDAALHMDRGRIDESSRVTVPQVSAVLRAMQNEFVGKARADIGFEPVSRPGELRPHVKAVMESFQLAPEDSPDRPYVRGRDLSLELKVDEGDEPLVERNHAHVRFSNAEVPDLSVYNRYLPGSQVRLLGGSGKVSGDLRLDGRGRAANGELNVRGRQASMDFAGIGLVGNIAADTRLKLRRNGSDEQSFDLTGSQIELSDVEVTRPGEAPISGWWAALNFDNSVLRISDASEVSASLRAQMKDLSVLLALYAEQKHFPKWIAEVVDDGEAKMTGRIDWSGRTLILDHFDGRNDRFQAMARLRLKDGQRDGNLYVSWHKLGLGLDLKDGNKDFRVLKPREWYDSQPDLLPP